MSYNILTAVHIQKKYGENTILHDVSMNVNQGAIYGLIGKNGSGKTTLFRILTGLVQEYNGNVTINKTDGRTSKVSAVINSPSLFLNMSAFQNMKEQTYLLGIHDDNKIEQVLNTVGLTAYGNKVVNDFSLGMTQRLKLGMALLETPDILILDEPANGLDPDGISELRELLLALNRTNKVTILVSSHILNELEQIATCIGILHNGEIVKEFSINGRLPGNEEIPNGMTLENIYMQYIKGNTDDVKHTEK